MPHKDSTRTALPDRIHRPKLSAFIPPSGAASTDAPTTAFFDDFDELYEAARTMMEHWELARSLRDRYHARLVDEVAGDAVFTRAERAELLGRAQAAVTATVDAFDEFMQQVAYGPAASVEGDEGDGSIVDDLDAVAQPLEVPSPGPSQDPVAV